MAKRKYARFGESFDKFECSNKKCRWQGNDEEKVTAPSKEHKGFEELQCPQCGNNEFLGLLNQ